MSAPEPSDSTDADVAHDAGAVAMDGGTSDAAGHVGDAGRAEATRSEADTDTTTESA